MFKDKSKIVLFSDMDGTLLGADKTLCERNREAIIRFRDAGGMFAAATGRVLQSAVHYFEPLRLDCPVILTNGGMIYDCAEKKVMWSESLPEEKARAMISELLEKFPQASAEICMPDAIYAVNVNYEERRHWEIGRFDAIVADSIENVPHGEFSKVLFAMPESVIMPFSEYASGLGYADDVELVSSSRIYHEMLPKNCTKGFAMKKLMQVYGLNDCVTVAMGDYYNDLAMLRNADFSACPSNAIDEVKAVCDVVCSADCGGGAVAEIIDHILHS